MYGQISIYLEYEPTYDNLCVYIQEKSKDRAGPDTTDKPKSKFQVIIDSQYESYKAQSQVPQERALYIYNLN